jgi:hypothetical protein
MRRILVLMASKDYNATSEGEGTTREAIVRALGEPWVPANWKDEFARLKKLGLTDSKAGQKGCVWLTPEGIKVAARPSPE